MILVSFHSALNKLSNHANVNELLQLEGLQSRQCLLFQATRGSNSNSAIASDLDICMPFPKCLSD